MHHHTKSSSNPACRQYREEGLTLRHKPQRKRRAALHRRERYTSFFPSTSCNITLSR
jgi:hypothetical protein